MAVQELLAELDVDFQPDETEMFYRELASVARDRTAFLGREQAQPEQSAALETLISQLGQDVVEFGPQLEVVPLKPALFGEPGLQMSPYLADLFRRSRFYLVIIPLTIVPCSGWNFVKLDSIVEFNAEQQDGERPVAFQLLPPDSWKSLIQARQSLRIGLNEDLEFKVDAAHLAGLLPTLQDSVRAGIDVAAVGAATLLVGPFDYAVRRPTIRTAGVKTPKAYWHMEGAETVTQEKPQLAVVLRVPQEVAQVDAVGVVKATRKFSVWAAWLEELTDLLRPQTADFVRTGAPKPAGREWSDITKGT